MWLVVVKRFLYRTYRSTTPIPLAMIPALNHQYLERRFFVRQVAANKHRIELHRLPPYSPEYMPVEGVWKVTRKMTTHNRFYATTGERDRALRATFSRFRREPSLVYPHVERFK